MKRVKSVIFNKFFTKIEEKRIRHLLIEIFNINSYSDEKGFGFSNVEFNDTTVSASLLKRNSTYVQDYDNQKSDLIKKQIFLFTSIQFNINIQQKIMTVYGSLTNLNIVKSTFRNIIDFDYTIESIPLDVLTFINNLGEKKVNYTIQQISVKGFNYNNGMIGRFTGDVTKQSTGIEIINNFKSDIIKISITIEIEENESIKMQLFPNGNIKFVSEDNDYDFYINFIKTLIIF